MRIVALQVHSDGNRLALVSVSSGATSFAEAGEDPEVL